MRTGRKPRPVSTLTPEEEAIRKAAAEAETRRKIAESKRGDRNPMKRAEVAQKVSATLKARHSGVLSENMKQRWRDGKIPYSWQRAPTSEGPNKAEVQLADILATDAPTFRYVGNKAFWIGPCPSGKRRNPDFVDSKAKLVILLHGEYWHTKAAAEEDVKDYEALGWKILIVWYRELRRKNRETLCQRIREFALSASRPSGSPVQLAFLI